MLRRRRCSAVDQHRSLATADDRTVRVDEAVGEQERQGAEGEPEAELQQPAAVVQVLVALVALILDAEKRRRHKPEEQLHQAWRSQHDWL